MIEFTVPGNPCPKPRMTRRDKWMQRPCVMKYRKFCTDVVGAYIDACRKAGVRQRTYPINTLSITFGWEGSLNVADLSNCVKSVEDALNGYAWPDDTMQYVRKYESVRARSVPKGSGYTQVQIMECE